MHHDTQIAEGLDPSLPSALAASLAHASRTADALASLAVAEVRFSIAAFVRALALFAAAALIGLCAFFATIVASFLTLRVWLPLPAAAAITAALLIVITVVLAWRASTWRDRMGLQQTRAAIVQIVDAVRASATPTGPAPSPAPDTAP